MFVSEIAKKAWRTKKRQNVGRTVAEHRRQLMLGVKSLLKRWNQDLEGKEACVVCGDGVPKTILQRHHIDPYDKSGEKIWLCASCHNIFNKIEETTRQSDVERDLNIRHKKFAYNRSIDL
jgi:5-methylcytosine-specific restriction endonuclease McrA